jgi:hypothetical protein
MHILIKRMKSIKKRALDDFLEINKHLPEQGSAEWLKSRSETIGGSEISTILKINKYQSIKQLIQQKTGISTFKKSAPLWFGNIFEYILQQYVEKLYDTKIYETGSIPYKKSKYIKYSPDGLAIIKKHKLKNIFNDNDFNNKIYNISKFENDLYNNKELLILFEFKNPFMRVIKPNEIPIYYINQPKLGMEVIDICEASIFIESVFRYCSYNDIINLNNKYNTFYHFDKIRYNNKPLSYGCFTLYYEKNNNSNHLHDIIINLIEYLNTNNIHHYDISNIKDKNIINKIMENIIDYKDIKIMYHDLCINNNIYDDNNLYYFNLYNNVNKFKYNIQKNKELIMNNNKLEYLGIMSFKMLDININPIFKSNPLNDNVLNTIEKVINTIKECNKLNTIEDKKKIIDQFKI